MTCVTAVGWGVAVGGTTVAVGSAVGLGRASRSSGIGVTVAAAPTFRGWQWVGVISPVFVTLLLTKVSGIPLLEKKAERRWGGNPDYEHYKSSTPVLVPHPWRR